MVSAITNFYQAALYLQKVFQDEQKFRERNRSARLYYREQKTRTLSELSKYQFLFSKSYRRFREDVSYEPVLDIGDPWTNMIIRTAIESGKSYQETYQEISGFYNTKIREIGKKGIDRTDPTDSKKWEKKYIDAILPLIDNFQKRVIIEFNQAWKTGEVRQREEVRKIDPKKLFPHIDEIAEEEIRLPAEEVTKEIIPKVFGQGTIFASEQLGVPIDIQFGGTLEQRQESWKKIGNLIESSNSEFQGYSNKTSQDIKRIISDGILNEKTQGQIIKDIQAQFGVGKEEGGKLIRDAERIIRTETQKAVTQGVLSKYKEEGLEPSSDRQIPPIHPDCRCTVIPDYQDGKMVLVWLACGDDRVCAECEALDGTIVSEGEPGEEPTNEPEPEPAEEPDDQLEQNISDWTGKYGDADIEHYSMFDEKGNEIESGTGEKSEVIVDGNMKDKIVIHNHPSGNQNFSLQDLDTTFYNDLKGAVVSTKDGSISITRPSEGWPDPTIIEPTWDKVVSENREYINKVAEDIKSGKISFRDGEVDLDNKLHSELYYKLNIEVTRK